MDDKELYELFEIIVDAETPEERDDAEAKIAAHVRDLETRIGRVEAYAEKLAALCPPDDWPESGGMADAALADTGRGILAMLAATEGA